MKQEKLSSFNFVFGKKKDVTSFLLNKISFQKNIVILPTSLNDLAAADSDNDLRKVYRRVNFCVTDGVPLVWFFLIKNFFRKNKSAVERVYGPTLMTDILGESKNKFRHFFYGSGEQTIKKLEKKLLSQFPNLQIAGLVSPPFRDLNVTEEKAYLAQIRRKKVDILWLGISSPKQVKIAVKWKRFLPNTSIICVGAAFDYVAGSTSKPPVWMQINGLEWFYRLLTNPKRLSKRYLFDIPYFLIRRFFGLFYL